MSTGIGKATAGPRELELLPPTLAVTETMLADPRSGFALQGFDPVSYFLGPEPAPGRADLELIWGGVAWRFASEANREAFRRHPEAYAPRLGGHDAAAVTAGLLVEAQPHVHLVAEGRLYLFRTPESRARWLAVPALRDAAEARWAQMKGRVVQP